MDTIAGGLIQMNAHMIMTGLATAMVCIGVIVVAITLTIMICFWFEMARGKQALTIAFVLVGVILICLGVRQPRVKEIRACASGPVSLEQVAARYDIVAVDGKELTLRER